MALYVIRLWKMVDNCLTGKRILVLGATSDIGMQLVRTISCCNPKEVLALGRNMLRLNELKSSNVTLCPCDLSNDGNIDMFLETCQTIDGLVVSVGRVHIRPIKNEIRESVANLANEHLLNTINVIAKLTRRNMLAKGASIVFISSISGIDTSFVGGSLYSSMKGAISGLSMSLARELAYNGVRSNCICSGMIDTEKFRRMFSDEKIASLTEMHPLKRLGTPTDIANAVVFLLSDFSSWITGTNLKVDGGYTL